MSVFPTELEAILGQHPAVRASAVIGREDTTCGQKPVAFIILKPDAGETAESLVVWCRDAMAIYKVPEIRIRETLPMTATGKIKKQDLEKFL